MSLVVGTILFFGMSATPNQAAVAPKEPEPVIEDVLEPTLKAPSAIPSKPLQEARSKPVKVVPVSAVYTSQSELMAYWKAYIDASEVVHKAKILRMIDCESDGREKVQIIDVNGKWSRGILQFQDSTWAWMSAEAGISGSPLEGKKAIYVLDWALSNGLGSHWGCYNK